MTTRYDLIVIGSGPGGYVAAIAAAERGLKTACIEKGALGGTCLNIGCIPSKALLHSSWLFHLISNRSSKGLSSHGISVSSPQLDFLTMQKRKEDIVRGFNQGIAYLFKQHKVDHIQARAELTGPHTVALYLQGSISSSKMIEANTILLATGSEPAPLSFLPFDQKKILSSTEILSLSQIPKTLLVIGAGVIGVELGSVYQRLGAKVKIIEFLPRICPSLDPTISVELQKTLEKQGLFFSLSSKVLGATASEQGVILTYEKEGKQEKEEGDLLLCAVGRRPYTQGLGLEKVGLTLDPKGTLPVNDRFQTTVSSIYAIGDLIEGPMLAHRASEEAIAVARLLAGETPSIDYLALPNIVYTEPEVAAVGLTEEEAKKRGLSIVTGSSSFKINSRAKCTQEEEGFVKIIGDKTTGRLLGVHIIGAHASELIGEGVIAITKKLKVEDLAYAFHGHPTLSESIKEAALACLKQIA